MKRHKVATVTHVKKAKKHTSRKRASKKLAVKA
jgi:hypothetical protein